MAIGHYLDGASNMCCWHSYTRSNSRDTRVLEKGTAYQTDIGMCDYNSVIGMNKETL